LCKVCVDSNLVVCGCCLHSPSCLLTTLDSSLDLNVQYHVKQVSLC
jgi:hypothetical protein